KPCPRFGVSTSPPTAQTPPEGSTHTECKESLAAKSKPVSCTRKPVELSRRTVPPTPTAQARSCSSIHAPCSKGVDEGVRSWSLVPSPSSNRPLDVPPTAST